MRCGPLNCPAINEKKRQNRTRLLKRWTRFLIWNSSRFSRRQGTRPKFRWPRKWRLWSPKGLILAMAGMGSSWHLCSTSRSLSWASFRSHRSGKASQASQRQELTFKYHLHLISGRQVRRSSFRSIKGLWRRSTVWLWLRLRGKNKRRKIPRGRSASLQSWQKTLRRLLNGRVSSVTGSAFKGSQARSDRSTRHLRGRSRRLVLVRWLFHRNKKRPKKSSTSTWRAFKLSSWRELRWASQRSLKSLPHT